MRIWVKPDQLAKLNITVPEIISAVNSQNTVNPAGKIGGRPTPPGQEFTYTVLAQGRLTTEDQFGSIVLRATPDGAIVRLRDVARIELSAADYDVVGRYNGKPSAILALFQLPNSNAIEAEKGVKKLMEELKTRFPSDVDYDIPIDTTKSVTEGIREIGKTFWEALALVMLVVFIFLQGWRAALIPLAAVPVSLVGTFALFPLLGFSINTLSLFGLVLAIGLVVDDAIVVVEAVEHHIEEGMSPKEATLKAMEEVSGPGGGDRADPVGGISAHRVHSRHYGPALSAIRRDHRHLRAPLRLQRADAQSGPVRAAAAAQAKSSRARWACFLTGSIAAIAG